VDVDLVRQGSFLVRATDLRQTLYGLAAAAGLAGTWYFNLTYSGEASYLSAWFANAASSSAAVDLLVAFTAGSIFMITEGRRLRMRAPWLYVVFGAVLAFAFTFPLFLLMRERVLHPRPAKTRKGNEDTRRQSSGII
jgi:drug/metabolite transporter (DMT)-like permease